MIGWRCRLLVRTAHAPRSLVASSTFSSFWLFLPSRISSSGRFLPQNRKMREGHIFDKISPTWTLISDISRGDGKVNSSSPQWGNCERNGVCLYILVSAGKQKNIINLENYWFLPSPKWKVFGRINQNRELINFRNFGSPASQKTTAITTHDSWQIQQKVIQRCSLIIGAKLGLKEKRERKSTTHALLLKKKKPNRGQRLFQRDSGAIESVRILQAIPISYRGIRKNNRRKLADCRTTILFIRIRRRFEKEVTSRKDWNEGMRNEHHYHRHKGTNLYHTTKLSSIRRLTTRRRRSSARSCLCAQRIRRRVLHHRRFWRKSLAFEPSNFWTTLDTEIWPMVLDLWGQAKSINIPQEGFWIEIQKSAFEPSNFWTVADSEIWSTSLNSWGRAKFIDTQHEGSTIT